MTTILDTSAVIAIYKPTDKFHTWATAEIVSLKLQGPLIVTDVVYAEFSVTFATRADADKAITQLGLQRLQADDDVLFRVGQACNQFVRNNGRQGRTLPDYFVGATAEIAGCPLMTSNPKHFVNYFPGVTLIRPPAPPAATAVATTPTPAAPSPGP